MSIKKELYCYLRVSTKTQEDEGHSIDNQRFLGKRVSKKKHFTAKKDKRLQKHGYFTQKGKFGFVKKSPLKSKKKHGTRKGDIRKTARRAYETKSGKKLW